LKWYCQKCKTMHNENEMCPHISKELKKHPEWLAEAANFTVIAAQYNLISSQNLDKIVQPANKLLGADLHFEGSYQYARDIRVFNRLNSETFKNSGIFNTPQSARQYLQHAEANSNLMGALERKLTGSAQEVDWLNFKEGQLRSVFEKSRLLDGNAPGIDGITINRFSGNEISKTTIKASANNSSTGISGVRNAIKAGTATETDVIYGTQGMAEQAKRYGLKNPVVEHNSAQEVQASNERLKNKIVSGNATTQVTFSEVGKQIAQGSVIGAAVSLTVSSITNYIRYKNGKLSQKEAFSNVAEDTIKGALIGGALAGITIFLPQGAIGFIAGVGIGIYLDSVCTNILDEIFGKGAYDAILNSSGYVYGMTCNLLEQINKIENNMQIANTYYHQTEQLQQEANNNLAYFEQQKGE